MFSSGPHVSCYRARSTDDGQLLGPRCVKFANFVHSPGTAGIAFVWYAEGTGPGGPFRHFGESYWIPGAGQPVGRAAGLSGNGEHSDPVLRLRFRTDSPAGEVPMRLLVGGDRKEEWILVPDGVIADYSPLPRRIAKAGSNFHEFTVRKQDGTPGTGVRMMLHSGSWLGAGRWGDMTYLHLGTFIGDPTASRPSVRFGAADIGLDTHYSGSVPWGEMSVRQTTPDVRQVTGVWTEEWYLRHAGPHRPDDPATAALTVLG